MAKKIALSALSPLCFDLCVCYDLKNGACRVRLHYPLVRPSGCAAPADTAHAPATPQPPGWPKPRPAGAAARAGPARLERSGHSARALEL